MPKKSVKKAAKAAPKVARSTGSGRPQGSGKFGCPTKAIRIPVHLEQEVVEFALRKIRTGK
jgi:hypothetical protein